jgi:hypothetical protein
MVAALATLSMWVQQEAAAAAAARGATLASRVTADSFEGGMAGSTYSDILFSTAYNPVQDALLVCDLGLLLRSGR